MPRQTAPQTPSTLEALTTRIDAALRDMSTSSDRVTVLTARDDARSALRTLVAHVHDVERTAWLRVPDAGPRTAPTPTEAVLTAAAAIEFDFETAGLGANSPGAMPWPESMPHPYLAIDPGEGDALSLTVVVQRGDARLETTAWRDSVASVSHREDGFTDEEVGQVRAWASWATDVADALLDAITAEAWIQNEPEARAYLETYLLPRETAATLSNG